MLGAGESLVVEQRDKDPIAAGCDELKTAFAAPAFGQFNTHPVLGQTDEVAATHFAA
ncbi:hypothetical protein D3C77_660210 [compost metagenome]